MGLDETAQWGRAQWHAGLLLLLSISTVLLFMNANSDLVAAGEARAAEIAREMVERGNFVLPSLNDEVSAESLTKPPLVHWLIAASALAFGWDNAVVRLPSLLATLASIALVYLLGARMFDRRSGLLAALVLASSILFITHGVKARIDMVFAAMVLAAITAFYYGVTGAGARAVLLGYAAMALAVLAKGPAGVLIPLLVVGFYVWRNGGLRQHRKVLQLLPGASLFAALVLPWFIAVAVTAPQPLAHGFFFDQLAHWWRGDIEQAANQGSGWGYYLPYLLIGLFPWSVFLPVALWRGFRDRGGAHGRTLELVLVWFLGGLLLFSAGEKKAARYLLPMLPAAALLVGYYWAQLMPHARRHRLGVLIGAGISCIAVLAATSAILWALGDAARAEAWMVHGANRGDAAAIHHILGYFVSHLTAVTAALLLICAVGLTVLLVAARRRYGWAATACAAQVWIILLGYGLWVAPQLEMMKSPRQAVNEIRALLPASARVYAGGDAYKHAVRWYLERDLVRLEPGHKLYARLERDPQAWGILMSRQPPPPSVYHSREPARAWEADYYTLTLLPGHAAASAGKPE